MEIQLTLRHIGMQLDEAKIAFYTERKEPQPDSEMMGQLAEDFRDELEILEDRARSLRYVLRAMQDALEVVESSNA